MTEKDSTANADASYTAAEIKQMVNAEEGVARFYTLARLREQPEDNFTVSVLRTVPGSRSQRLIHTCSLSHYDEGEILRIAGEGSYICQLKDRDGKIAARYDFQVDPLAAQLVTARPNPRPADQPDEQARPPWVDELLAVFREARPLQGNQVSTGLHLGDIAQLAAAMKGGVDLNGIAAIIGAVATAVAPFVKSRQSPVGELVSALQAMHSMVGDSIGGGGADDSPAWLAPIIQSLQAIPAQPVPQPLPNPRPPLPSSSTKKKPKQLFHDQRGNPEAFSLDNTSPVIHAVAFGIMHDMPSPLIADNVVELASRLDTPPKWVEKEPTAAAVLEWLKSLTPSEMVPLFDAFDVKLRDIAEWIVADPGATTNTAKEPTPTT